MEKLNLKDLDLRSEYIIRFDENTELGELIEALYNVQYKLRGIGDDKDRLIIIKMAEEYIYDTYIYYVDNQDFYSLDKIEDDMFLHFMGCEKPKRADDESSGIPENEG